MTSNNRRRAAAPPPMDNSAVFEHSSSSALFYADPMASASQTPTHKHYHHHHNSKTKKLCTECGLEKAHDEFSTNQWRKAKDSLHRTCHGCQMIRSSTTPMMGASIADDEMTPMKNNNQQEQRYPYSQEGLGAVSQNQPVSSQRANSSRIAQLMPPTPSRPSTAAVSSSGPISPGKRLAPQLPLPTSCGGALSVEPKFKAATQVCSWCCGTGHLETLAMIVLCANCDGCGRSVRCAACAGTGSLLARTGGDVVSRLCVYCGGHGDVRPSTIPENTGRFRLPGEKTTSKSLFDANNARQAAIAACHAMWEGQSVDPSWLVTPLSPTVSAEDVVATNAPTAVGVKLTNRFVLPLRTVTWHPTENSTIFWHHGSTAGGWTYERVLVYADLRIPSEHFDIHLAPAEELLYAYDLPHVKHPTWEVRSMSVQRDIDFHEILHDGKVRVGVTLPLLPSVSPESSTEDGSAVAAQSPRHARSQRKKLLESLSGCLPVAQGVQHSNSSNAEKFNKLASVAEELRQSMKEALNLELLRADGDTNLLVDTVFSPWMWFSSSSSGGGELLNLIKEKDSILEEAARSFAA